MKTLAIALLFLAAACGDDNASAPSAAAPKAQPRTPPDPETAPTVAPEPASNPEPIRIEGGFESPHSIVSNYGTGYYLVSNINGNPSEADGNGFISKITFDGKLIELKWIDGLNAPKGMTVFLDTVWVADLNVVRKFDAATGEPRGVIKIKGAKLLNDLEQMNGIVYVSDGASGSDAVYAIARDGTVTVEFKSPTLKQPSGLLYADRLYMVTFGANELHSIYKDKSRVWATLPKGRLHGVVMFHETLFISSWDCGCIYAGPAPNGPYVPVIENLKTPAAIELNGPLRRLFIPLLEENAVVIYEVQKAWYNK